MNNQHGKIFEGTIISVHGRTATVEVIHAFAHPLYRKTTKRMRTYLADTAGIDVAVGDAVRIQETKPMSRHKHFVIVSKAG